MNKKILISLLIIIVVTSFICLPKSTLAKNYKNVSENEYKDFLKTFLREKYYENKDEEADDGSISDSCVGNINVTCKGIYVTSTGQTYDLDTYVAGVISAEASFTVNGKDELGKAWAVITRSYAVAYTNNCTTSIDSSSYTQNFDSSDTTTYKKHATETNGIVITKNNKDVFGAPYALSLASDCIPVDGNKCKFKRCTVYADDISDCTSNGGEVFEFIVPQGIVTYSGGTHAGGIEPYIASYLVSEGNMKNYKYNQIIKAFYGKNANVAKMGGSSSKSSDCNKDDDKSENVTDNNGITFPVKNYDNVGGDSGLIKKLQKNKYFANAGSNISQCPWYAKARALEIVNTSNLSSKLKTKATAVLNQTTGNGIDWYGGVNSTLGDYFAYSSDINKPRAGSLIAWSGGNGHNYGHVGIIEKVNKDGSVVLSDGWNSGGAEAADTWDNVTVHTRTMTIDELKTYDGYHLFEGYTYLFSYRK